MWSMFNDIFSNTHYSMDIIIGLTKKLNFNATLNQNSKKCSQNVFHSNSNMKEENSLIKMIKNRDINVAPSTDLCKQALTHIETYSSFI